MKGKKREECVCVCVCLCVCVSVYTGNESDIKIQARPGRASTQPPLSSTGGGRFAGALRAAR